MAARFLQQGGSVVLPSLFRSVHLRLLSATSCLQRIDASKWGELPIVHVKATDNNTMCTVSNSQGERKVIAAKLCYVMFLFVQLLAGWDVCSRTPHSTHTHTHTP